ncbi:hypothetical protein [Streptomyces flavofungini]|uniref:Uncharacterized protein n=1 Tax=Streptomyces flavofungini TaxID=68200 RepID=A0ABS0XBE7_9ACTN|nr:hypothetical protein [Streptomyces flavofungini]MBJ3810535.1 hypothetical protein [Streptomyces flavofungini]GHC84094.1 hypothetical protein GCM10010349_68840 [Streptomyces flavofungini]
MTGPVHQDHVVESTDAATQALDHLERALEAAGFPGGRSAYRRMAEVLLAQRWSTDAPLDPRALADFEQIALTAGRIYAMLQPYVEVMRSLASLAPDAPGSPGTRPADPAMRAPGPTGRRAAPVGPTGPGLPATEAVRAAVLAELQRRGRRAASVSVLARTARSSIEAAEAVLAGLVGDGTVQVRTVGSECRYLLTAPRPTRRTAPRTARGTR